MWQKERKKLTTKKKRFKKAKNNDEPHLGTAI